MFSEEPLISRVTLLEILLEPSVKEDYVEGACTVREADHKLVQNFCWKASVGKTTRKT